MKKNCTSNPNPHAHHQYMREVKSKSESNIRPLIDPHRSSQQTRSERERSPSQTEGEPMQLEMLPRRPHSQSHSHSRPRPILFLLISAIVLPIATIFAAVFEFKSRDFAGFNVFDNVLNSEFNLEKSGLIDNEYDFSAVLPATTNDTIGVPGLVLNETRSGLGEFNDLGYVFGVLFNENEINNEIECESGMFIFPKIRYI